MSSEDTTPDMFEGLSEPGAEVEDPHAVGLSKRVNGDAC